jgi:hypothetical protein
MRTFRNTSALLFAFFIFSTPATSQDASSSFENSYEVDVTGKIFVQESKLLATEANANEDKQLFLGTQPKNFSLFTIQECDLPPWFDQPRLPRLRGLS